MRAAFGLALFAAATLGGCGQSDAQIRDELRAQLMNRCSRDIAPGTSDLPGFDANVFCGCITDKAMGERSVAELKTLFDEGSRPEMLAQGRQAATECLAQLSENDAAEKAAPVPDSDNAATPAPAAAPAQAAERERPREKAVEPAAPSRPRIEDVRDTPQPRTEPVVPPRATPQAPSRAVPPGFTPPPEPAVRDEKAGSGDRG